jgi:hypothetical protein
MNERWRIGVLAVVMIALNSMRVRADSRWPKNHLSINAASGVIAIVVLGAFFYPYWKNRTLG